MDNSDITIICIVSIAFSIAMILLERFFTETDDGNDIGEGW